MGIKDGGPAFPHERVFSDSPNDLHHKYIMMSGMSLRDYFAAAALQSILSNPVFAKIPETTVAASSYEYADAMIAERSKNEN